MALFSALDVSVRKKTCDLHDFLCILHETELPLVFQTSTAITTSTYFILLSDRLIFRNSLSLEKKWVRVTAHYACVNVHISRTIGWIATSGHK